MLRKAFSLLEIMVVVIVIGILAAVVVPRFAKAGDDARTASTESVLGSVRASVASFRTAAVIAGTDPYPTLQQLTGGTVVRFDLPANPFTGVHGVQTVTRAQAMSRAVVNQNAAGWNYFVDNESDPPFAIFYSNAQSQTTRTNQAGNPVPANQL
jgi:prepilin-type N-terminal cleavage/methylation domain-containing protein